jgi:hypothetical protein
VVAAVYVERLAGDEAAGGIVRQEGGSDAQVVDADEAVRGRVGFRRVEQLVEFGDSGGGERSGRDDEIELAPVVRETLRNIERNRMGPTRNSNLSSLAPVRAFISHR